MKNVNDNCNDCDVVFDDCEDEVPDFRDKSELLIAELVGLGAMLLFYMVMWVH